MSPWKLIGLAALLCGVPRTTARSYTGSYKYNDTHMKLHTGGHDVHGQPQSRCIANFTVWQPDDDVLRKLDDLEREQENLMTRVEKKMAELKNDMLSEVIKAKNDTIDLDRKLLDFKNHDVKLDLLIRDLRIEYLELKSETDKIAMVMSQVQHDSSYGRNVNLLRPSNLKEGFTPSTKDVSKVTSSEIKHIQSDLVQYKEMLNDLKAEWINIKRESTRSAGDIQSLISTQGGLKEDIAAIKSRINGLVHDFGKFEDEQNRVLKTVQRHLMSGKLEIKYPPIVSTEQQEHAASLQTMLDQALQPTDCHDVYRQGFHVSGVYRILPDGGSRAESVYCDMNNGTAWTVIQRRQDGTIDFNRGWMEYQYGFGNLYGEFWLGNEFLHKLTAQKEYLLRVEMESWEGKHAYAQYNYFRVESADEKYKLHVKTYSGDEDAGDSLSIHDGMFFSTGDYDNDEDENNCAKEYTGGWWFKSCIDSNLNGVYRKGHYNRPGKYPDGVVWFTYADNEYYSMKRTEMKIRPYYI